MENLSDRFPANFYDPHLSYFFMIFFWPPTYWYFAAGACTHTAPAVSCLFMLAISVVGIMTVSKVIDRLCVAN
jgi:hypothetical protein